MSTLPVVVVAGLGRCGSSMTMQMLAAGGMVCVGRFPAFEDENTESEIDPDWFASLRGHAVKILDPQRVGIPQTRPARVIWLDRRPAEQAKSICKMLRLLESMPMRSRHINTMQRALTTDRRLARSVIGDRPFLTLQFEETLARPLEAAQKLQQFIAPAFGPHFQLDVQAMASAVRPRSPLCAPDLAMELSLTQESTP